MNTSPKNKHRKQYLQYKSSKKNNLESTKSRKRLIRAWRTLIYIIISGLLIPLLVLYGWSPLKKDQIKVYGNDQIKKNSVINASSKLIGKPLLGIVPSEIENNLKQKLPIQSVKVTRIMIPPKLEINLKEIEPIGYATRKSSKGEEKGIVDIKGQWIPIEIAKLGQTPSTDLYIDGWMPFHKDRIARILEKRNELGSALKSILLTQTGELSLETKSLGQIKLGKNFLELESQLSALTHLSKNLPEDFRNKPGTIIDLTDPSKPEIQVPLGL